MKSWDTYGRAGNVIAVLETHDRLMRFSQLKFYRETDPSRDGELMDVMDVSVMDDEDIRRTSRIVVLTTDQLEALANLFGARDNTLAFRVKELEADRDRLQNLVEILTKAIQR